MYECGFIILHKSEHARQLLKWALLCAATKQCINPDDSELYCPSDRTSIGKCHRYDQSVFGILNVNSEYKRSVHDNGKPKYNLVL
uniref:Leishmanolysin-like peptidase n=1 Tax=Meloidogyne hapla TaxID=6305 RepID=A0A1I8B9K6_MELHA